jgi:hypothetical protein
MSTETLELNEMVGETKRKTVARAAIAMMTILKILSIVFIFIPPIFHYT